MVTQRIGEATRKLNFLIHGVVQKIGFLVNQAQEAEMSLLLVYCMACHVRPELNTESESTTLRLKL